MEIVESTRLEPEAIEARSLLVGVDRCCAFSAARGVVDGDAAFGRWSCQDEVVRKLRERRIRRAGRERLQRPRDPKVELAAGRPGQRRIEHIADQRVREPPCPARRARLHQGVRDNCLVEECRDLARGAVLERHHQVERDLDADHRCAGEKFPARVAETCKPPADDGLHAFGDTQRLTERRRVAGRGVLPRRAAGRSRRQTGGFPRSRDGRPRPDHRAAARPRRAR